jgi:hypothetical protein
MHLAVAPELSTAASWYTYVTAATRQHQQGAEQPVQFVPEPLKDNGRQVVQAARQ